MECREDLKSILPFLPFVVRSSSIFWPPKAAESFKALTLGPDASGVDSGAVLFDAILDIRESLGLSFERLEPNAADGYCLFFDDLMSRADSRVWFGEVLPKLGNLLLRLPSLLEAHYLDSDEKFGKGKNGLRLMDQQEAGIVLLSQELVAGILACAFFCLFPISRRAFKYLPAINFDYLFGSLHSHCPPSQEHKIMCITHYFERICQCMPKGFVSFERKVLPLRQSCHAVSYPESAFWKRSMVPLCSFQTINSGLIEDQQHEALEVDFANEYLGGGALHMGCVQEEIRFMINPELIVGMLFMVSMKKNEAIEIIGVERFSRYTGYGFTFRFVGGFVDEKPLDHMNRRKVRIIAMDAVDSPGNWQFGIDCLVREINKAYCGFIDQSKYACYVKISKEGSFGNSHTSQDEAFIMDSNECIFGGSSTQNNIDVSSSSSGYQSPSTFNLSVRSCPEIFQEDIGIATGNWGCGAFGGDPQIKAVLQWLAASQALRPFIHYYTFGVTAMQKLEEASLWILSHGWTVGDLWCIMVEYSTQRLNEASHSLISVVIVENGRPDPVHLQSNQEEERNKVL
ncbi:hypothetical protein HPP92_006768 [Vanilla planifolia]|uniref:poly(ADP-ribose) glycohydrolase n=2 Tax=Vanilla planifolia TaxID=51239 RepID=A0A835RCT7_VANPL|nr:hypothetical protein HPP92_006768 [Vanilla planifolia]